MTQKKQKILLLVSIISTFIVFSNIKESEASDEKISPLMTEKKNPESQEKSKDIGDNTQQTIEGTYYDWTVLEFKENAEDEKKCYIVSFPIKKIGNYEDEREPYILITNFQERAIEEISIYSGYEYKLNSSIYLSIDNESNYELFTKGDLAWAKTPQIDKEIIQKMLKGSIMKVRGDSSRGSYTVDEYSLKGITKAYRKMKEMCQKENTQK